MSSISVALPFSAQPHFDRTLRQFIESPLVEKIFVVHGGQYKGGQEKCEGIVSSTLTSGKTLNTILGKVHSDYFLFVSESQEFQLGQASLERFTGIAHQVSAGICYADYVEVKMGVRSEHPVIDYQFGSIRDNFDFGALLLFSASAVRESLSAYGAVADVEAAGVSDLRLKVSVAHTVFHIQEYLYTKVESDLRLTGEKLFDYVDPRNQRVQKKWRL